MKSKDDQVIVALQYLLDEGFITCGKLDGEPALFLTTDLSEVHKTLRAMATRESKKETSKADWWKECQA
jgi:hypothetical protein